MKVTSYGSSTNSAYGLLVVNFVPTILTQPQAVFLPTGYTNVMAVTVSGTSPLHYQWLSRSNAIVGATNFSLTTTIQSGQDIPYNVIITNAYGAVTSVVVQVVNSFKPNVAFPMPNFVLTPGQAAGFTNYVNGIPSPDTYWYKNGVLLTSNIGGLFLTNIISVNSGFTNIRATLFIPSITLADAATYSYICSNLAGIATTSATLSVGYPPSITSHPTNQTVECGQAVTVNGTATFPSPGGYQWYFSTNPVVGGTNATLSFSAVAVSNAGSYTLVASNAFGVVTSSNAILTVTHLAGPTVNVPATVMVAASDPSGATVTFAPTANDACDGALSVVCSPAAGSVFPAGTNAVTAVATDSGGNAATNSFLVIVQVPPVITNAPSSVTVGVGQPASFSGGASGLPAPVYFWLKNGIPTGDTGPSLTIAATALTDAGTYAVIASNAVGSVTSSSAILAVGVSPAITQQPTNLTVECGQAATLMAAVSSIPTGVYQWYYFTNAVMNGTNSTLVFNPAGATNAGDYTLVASNAFGVVTSSNAILTVTHLAGPTVNVPATVMWPRRIRAVPRSRLRRRRVMRVMVL